MKIIYDHRAHMQVVEITFKYILIIELIIIFFNFIILQIIEY